MKIVFLDESTITLNGDMNFSCLEELGDFTMFPNSTEAEILARAAGAECIVVNKVLMTEKVITSLPDLKHIAVIATGYNNIDIKAASAAGISVSNVRGYARYCVPQHVFALLLNLATRVHQYNEDVKRGEWQKSSSFTLLTYPTFELAGKTIGIIGFGTTGRGVAKIAEGFGMKVMVNNRSDVSAHGYKNYTLDEIFTGADVITLHCPLTEQNKHLINGESLKKMKKSSLLINTARGPLVDQTALAAALNSGEIAGAGVDVLDEEPPQENPLLEKVKNLILTPHSAWSTREARQSLIDEVAKNITSYAAGEKRNIIN